MIVRPATPADVDDVLALMREIPGLPQWRREALAVQPQDAQPARRLLVATMGETLIGFAQTLILLDEVELETIAVDPAWRGQGVGRLLLQEAMQAARADRATSFRLEVRRNNQAALHLYRSAGMVECGTRRGYYHDPFDDALLFQLAWV